MADFGIKVYPRDDDDSAVEALMTTKYPFVKLDSQDESSLRTTRITILTEPAQNTPVLLAAHEHGFGYSPQYWVTCYVVNPPAGATYVETYTNTGQVFIRGQALTSNAVFGVRVGDNDIEYSIRVNYNGSFPPPLAVGGMVIDVTTYLFVDELFAV